MYAIRKCLTGRAGLCLLLSVSMGAHAEMDPMGALSDWTASVSEATGGSINLSGYMNAHVMKHDGVPELVGKNLNDTLVQLRELSLFGDVVITDSLLFSTELEISYDFTDNDTSGRQDAFEAVLNYYYFDADITNMLDWDADESGTLRVRVGRILVPFLRYNENKPSYKQKLMSQPFTAWQLVPVNNVAISYQQFGWTDTGIMVGWNYATEDNGILDFKLSLINGLGSEAAVLDSNTVTLSTGPTIRPRDGLVNARSEWDDFGDVNSDKAIVLKFSYVPYTMPLSVGVSWYTGAWNKAGDQDLTMFGVHANYVERDWSIKGEHVTAEVEQTAGIDIVGTGPPPAVAVNTSTGDYEMMAWYVEGAYTPLRYGVGENYLAVILRFDEVDTNDQVGFSPFNRTRTTVGLEWQFMNNVRLRAEWQKSKLVDFANAPGAPGGPYIGAGGEEDITMKMISLIANF